jgi:tRNA 2-selenouridine synthase
MADLPLSGDFRSIVLNRTPLIDVRAPVEFAKGAFPGAVNLPLMNDEERRLVGIRYKEAGNAEAIKLGHELVGGAVKVERVEAWKAFKAAHPDAKLYCFRGGQRSQIAQEWLDEAGTAIVRLRGGYKAFRNYLLEQIEEAPRHFSPLVLGGRTGSGKTLLLQQIDNAIDLEGLANHRGSSFGRKITPQPSQIDFENALAYDLIRKLDRGYRRLVFEDEGRNVGSLYLPKAFAEFLREAPLVILETPTPERVAITYDEYVAAAQQLYARAGFDDPLQAWADDIRGAMKRIEKRLGSQRYREVRGIFDHAVGEQQNGGSTEAHKAWVGYLLREYYDPMYDYQIQKRADQVVFRGSADEVLAYFEKSESGDRSAGIT